MKKILVIGGGASGMMAAICAAKKGATVTIYEKSDRVGKKILATGNGKCNLTNLDMGIEHYYTNYPDKLAEYLEIFSEQDTISFFEENGLMLRERDGYVYPYSEQASVVLDILRNTLVREKIHLYTSVTDISIKVNETDNFQVKSSVGKENFNAVILACGSKAGIKNPDETGYMYAKSFGHHIATLYPALVQVRCKESFFKLIAGVRSKAKITLLKEELPIAYESGEIQFTDYGISGIPVFQISRIISGCLDHKEKISVSVDFFPHMSIEEWKEFYNNRIQQYMEASVETFLLGLLNKKISTMLLKEYNIASSELISPQNQQTIRSLCNSMKDFRVSPFAVNSFEQAQVCRGGVKLEELDDTLQSLYQKNLYICGEMVDIDGKCGGYNLQWAWTSGYIAGISAAK